MYKQYQQSQPTIKIEQPNGFNNKLSFTAIKTIQPTTTLSNATAKIIAKAPGLNGVIGLNKLNNTNTTLTTTTLKRPFIMFAILFVVGLNVFQFT
jgi:hypothetical protein